MENTSRMGDVKRKIPSYNRLFISWSLDKSKSERETVKEIIRRINEISCKDPDLHSGNISYSSSRNSVKNEVIRHMYAIMKGESTLIF